MEQNYLKLIPKWFEEQTKHDLVLSDDLDSLLSCAILNKVKGWKVRYFYDFEHTYKSTKLEDEYKENDRVWVDIAVMNGEKAFDNHLSMVTLFDNQNDQMINPNQFCWIANEIYGDKYAGSTALMLWSLYDLPLPETDEGKMLLLSIDSSYMGHYRGFQSNTFFIKDVFGFDELIRLMKRKKAYEFQDVINQYRINDKLKYQDGKIKTKLKLDEIGKLLGVDLNILEDDTYKLWKEYEICDAKVTADHSQYKEVCPDAFTLAFTFKNKIRYSRERSAGER